MYDAFYYSETTNPKLPAQASRQEELESRLHCQETKEPVTCGFGRGSAIALGERFSNFAVFAGIDQVRLSEPIALAINAPHLHPLEQRYNLPLVLPCTRAGR